MDNAFTFASVEEERDYWKNKSQILLEKYEELKTIYESKIGRKRHFEDLDIDPETKWTENAMRKKFKKSETAYFSPTMLQDDISKLVLQHFNKRELLKLTEVSKSWNKWVENNTVLTSLRAKIDLAAKTYQNLNLSTNRKYKSICCKYDEYSKEAFFRLLYQASDDLEELIIDERIPTEVQLKRISFPNVFRMIFKSHISDDICQWFDEKMFENLQVLHINRFGFNEDLIRFIQTLPDLKELRVIGDKDFYEGWESLNQGLKHAEGLEDENLVNCDLISLYLEIPDDVEMFPFSFLSSQLLTMKKLSVSEMRIPYYISYILTEFHALKELRITFSKKMSVRLIDELITMLANYSPCPNLRILSIYDIDILSEELVMAIIGLYPNLEEIRFENSTITWKILQWAARYLSNLNTICCMPVDPEVLITYASCNKMPDFNHNIAIIEFSDQ